MQKKSAYSSLRLECSRPVPRRDSKKVAQGKAAKATAPVGLLIYELELRSDPNQYLNRISSRART